MRNLRRVFASSMALMLMLGGPVAADDARELTWDDLIPEREVIQQNPDNDGGSLEDLLNDGSWADDSYGGALSAPAFPSGVVDELNGVQAKLPGFVVPLELDGEGKIKEFLLVPYFGACIHYPPPPPNQIVYVVMDEPVEVESTWAPIWATGELKTEFFSSTLGSAGYTMTAQLVEEYEY